MKDKTRLFILKLLTASAVFSAVYSSVLVFRVLLFNISGGFIAFLFTLLLFIAGVAAGSWGGISDVSSSGRRLIGKISQSKAAGVVLFYKNSEEKVRVITSFVLYCSGIAPVLITIALFQHKGILRTAFEAGFILIAYFLAVKCGLNEAYGNMTSRTAWLGLVVFILSFGASCYYAPVMFLKQYISIFGYVFLLSYLIVKNQEDIDYNIYSGRYVEKSVLPKEMRGFNLKFVILLFTIILLLLNLKVVAMLLVQIGNWLLAGLRALFSLLGSGAPTEQVEEVREQAGAIGFPFLGGSEQRPEHPLLTYIKKVLITTILLYAACKLFKTLWRYIFKKLLPMLADMFRRFFKPGNKEGFETGGDYYDEIEFEKPGDERVSRRQARARVKKARRDLRNITDPVERVRCIYAAVLGLLQARGIGIEGSDTVWDVYAKSAGIAGIVTPLNTVSLQYERVRYGSMVPGKSELAETEKSYSEITTIFLGKKKL